MKKRKSYNSQLLSSAAETLSKVANSFSSNEVDVALVQALQAISQPTDQHPINSHSRAIALMENRSE